MCGRYTISTPGALLQESFNLGEEPDLVARYNVAPTQEAPVILVAGRGSAPRQLLTMRWGLIPEFAKEPKGGARAISARCESLTSRPTFRDSFKSRRCLVPADGFFEWQRRGSGKQPFLAHYRDGRAFAFAGLWSEWRERPSDAPLRTFTIVTCPSNRALESLHDRMPVVLAPDRYSQWLDRAADPQSLRPLLEPAAADAWEVRPVSTRVNSVRNDDIGCLEPPEQRLLF